ncbi:MAG: rod shape-determining protein MreC [Bacteroidales bacterium]|nr:rod shape-determining protein MreC [Bacteroidales bacterium]
MRNFFYFLARHATFLFFLILEGLCLLLVFNFNDYHKTALLSSSNAICSSYYSAQDGVSHYFHLGSANEQLVEENAQLRNQISLLKQQLELLKDTGNVKLLADSIQKYHYIAAHVINSSTNRSRNYLTIDKGTKNGIQRDMFVINGSGVVGLVSAVSTHYATILPLVNTSMHLSVKLAHTNYRGQLIWNGVSPKYALMVDVPEHAAVAVGDSIVTSGSSSFFPEGILVGQIDEVNMDKNGGFYRLNIQLATDFNSVYDVEVIENKQQTEQRLLESKNN